MIELMKSGIARIRGGMSSEVYDRRDPLRVGGEVEVVRVGGPCLVPPCPEAMAATSTCRCTNLPQSLENSLPE
jgi:hypothetical protein